MSVSRNLSSIGSLINSPSSNTFLLSGNTFTVSSNTANISSKSISLSANTINISANGSTGTAGQILTSNGSAAYWSNNITLGRQIAFTLVFGG